MILFLGFSIVFPTQDHESQDKSDQGGDTFEPLNVELKHTITIGGTPDEVFPLLGPEGSRLLMNTEIVYFFGSGDELPGAMFRIGEDRWYVVAEHNPKDLVYRSVLLMPDVEFLVNEIRLAPGLKERETMATVTWRIVGVSENASREIQDYLDHEGLFEKQVEQMGRRIGEYLKKRKK